jgi:hypothetical protein
MPRLAPAPPPAAAPGPGALAGVPPPEDAYALRPPTLRPEIHFETKPGWAVELGVRAGIGMLAGSDARGAFANAGGVLRAHYKYYEAGFFYDLSDDSANGGSFTHFGGFAGAWLPYYNWVDFELALGIGSRQYADEDPRYGPGGYELGSPAISWILGVSDRARSDSIGGRVGGQLIVTYDAKQQDRAWKLFETNNVGELTETNGTTHVGGLSIGLVLTLGLDFGDAP